MEVQCVGLAFTVLLDLRKLYHVLQGHSVLVKGIKPSLHAYHALPEDTVRAAG